MFPTILKPRGKGEICEAFEEGNTCHLQVVQNFQQGQYYSPYDRYHLTNVAYDLFLTAEAHSAANLYTFYTHTHRRVHIHLYIHLHLHLHIHIPIHIHIYIRMHIHIHIRIYTYILI